MPLNEYQQELCTTSTWDFTDLRALYVNCTLMGASDVDAHARRLSSDYGVGLGATPRSRGASAR